MQRETGTEAERHEGDTGRQAQRQRDRFTFSIRAPVKQRAFTRTMTEKRERQAGARLM